MDTKEKILENEHVHVLLNQEDIKNKVISLGKEITRDYEGKELVLVGVLTGCFIFMADLCREIELDTEISFLQLLQQQLISEVKRDMTLVWMESAPMKATTAPLADQIWSHQTTQRSISAKDERMALELVFPEYQ